MNDTITILGGGISGLATAWHLRDQAEVTIVEKSPRLGGRIQTIQKKEFFFERGPRGFRPHPATLALIRELGLEKELIRAHPASRKRYLYLNGRLQRVNLPFLFRHGLLTALWNDHKAAPSQTEDETIEQFFLRRTNRKLTENLIDPLTVGLFGGDYRNLSMKRCFPKLWEWEKHYGSLLKGVLANRKSHHQPLLSFRGGMETMVRTLARKLPAEIKLSTTGNGGDFSCFPPPDLPHLTVTVVNFGYRSPVLKKRGSCYLVPSSEKSPVLGVIWDSEIFPVARQTKLCVILRHEPENPYDIALENLKRHLGITQRPDVYDIHGVKNGLPQ